MVEMSSLARLFRIVVLPALSRPRSKILNSRSGEDFSFLYNWIINIVSTNYKYTIPENAEESHRRDEENKWSSDENSKLMPINKSDVGLVLFASTDANVLSVLTNISDVTIGRLCLAMKLIHCQCDRPCNCWGLAPAS